MSELSNEKSQSIIETSLTELAFIFFFVLLAFSALKISEVTNEKKEADQKVDSLEKDRKRLVHAFLPIQEAVTSQTVRSSSTPPKAIDDSSLDEIFTGLEQTKQKALDVIEAFKTMDNQLSESGLNLTEVSKAVERVKALANSENGEKDLSQAVADIETQLMTLRGQNLNLRSKLASEGNGLDHPPCWADPKTGEIQFVYEITIAEDGVTVVKSWPESRAIEVSSKPYIDNGLGSYSKPQEFWTATERLYASSVEAECRHFVKVYDKASSKDAFKKYLLTIERHFYKLLL